MRRSRKQTPRKPAQIEKTPASLPTQKEGHITGLILDEAGTPLPGVMVLIQSTTLGSLTDEKGHFSIAVKQNPPFKVTVSFPGYESQTLSLADLKPIQVKLTEAPILTEEIVVTAARKPEALRTSPVTVFKVGLVDVQETPALNIYQMASYYPGVQSINATVLYSSFSINGLNQSSNPRVLSLVDGIDSQAAATGIVLGTINGLPDIDVASTEVVAGPASALYGPNAFNGVYSIFSKDAFQYQGLSVSQKLGLMHLDGQDRSLAPYVNTGIRYAKSFKDKVAVKGVIDFLHTSDWYATDTRDIANYDGTKFTTPGSNNPGYNGVNVYGDEVFNIFDATNTQVAGGPLIKDPIRVARRGYGDKDLFIDKTQNIRAVLAAQYRISPRHELIASIRYNYTQGNTQVLNIRSRAKGNQNYITSLELKHAKYWVRAYMNGESVNGNYNYQSLASGIMELAKPNTNWFPQFALAYNPDNALLRNIFNNVLTQAGRTPINGGDLEAAYAYADGDNRALYPSFFQTLRALGQDSLTAATIAQRWTNGIAVPAAHTAVFDSLSEKTRSLYLNEPFGSKNKVDSRFYHLEGQYMFPKVAGFDIMSGGSVRLYTIFTGNRFMYEKTQSGIHVLEGGGYLQANRRFIDDRLFVSGSIRFDKNTNFDTQISPRLAVSFQVGKERNHVFRAAFNSGFRPPTLDQQYSRVETLRGILVGGNEDVINLYHLQGGAYTRESIAAFRSARAQQKSIGEAATLLVPVPVKPIKPEVARCNEVGYRFLLPGRVSIDLSAYLTFNQDLVTRTIINGPLRTATSPLTLGQIDSAKIDNYDVNINLSETFETFGGAIQVEYIISRNFSLLANYSYNDFTAPSIETEDVIYANFAIQKHITRFLFTGRNIGKRWGFLAALNYTSAYTGINGVSARLTQPAFTTIDAQVSYKIPQLKSFVRVGGTNILNNRHTQVIGAGTVGATVYLQISFDELLH